MSPAGWLPRNGITFGTLRSVIDYGLPLPFYRHIKISLYDVYNENIDVVDIKYFIIVLTLMVSSFYSFVYYKAVVYLYLAPSFSLKIFYYHSQ